MCNGSGAAWLSYRPRWLVGRAGRRCDVLLLVAWFVGACLVSDTAFSQQVRLTLLDGRQVEATLSRMSASGKLEGEGVPPGLDFDGLRRLERISRVGESDKTAEPRVIVELHGGVIRATGVTMAEEKLQIAWPLGDPLAVPIDQVRAVRFAPTSSAEVFDEALANPSAEHDRLFVKIDDRLQSITGLVEKITAEDVDFDLDGRKRSLPRSQLFGIVVAQFEAAAKRPAKCRVSLAGGSRLAGEPASLADGRLQLRLAGDVTADLPLAAIDRIEVRSDRLTFLSDLEPVEVDETPLVTFARPWRRDRSSDGAVLSLGEQSQGGDRRVRRFEKGLGVHARSRLTFDVGGDYDQFAAVIGIDAETEGRGDCEFAVLADGREIYRQRVRGEDAPRQLQLDLDGVRRLTLLVEPGEELDLADHADWCDARLLRNEEEVE